MSSLENSKSFLTIERIANSGKIPHAFLIEGDVDSTGISIALFLAKCCVCEGEVKPCGNCRQCLTVSSGSNPDISIISAEDGKKNISIAQIRAMRSEAFIKPHAAIRRVFIIKNAELMNEAAQNALLKVLEEPPQCVVFILLTASRTLLLQTVISRCTLLSTEKSEANLVDTVVQSFLELALKGQEYEILSLLQPFEKDRRGAENFFLNLKIAIKNELKASYNLKSKAKILNSIYDRCDFYLDLLKTNINLPLLFCAVTSEIKQLTEN